MARTPPPYIEFNDPAAGPQRRWDFGYWMANDWFSIYHIRGLSHGAATKYLQGAATAQTRQMYEWHLRNLRGIVEVGRKCEPRRMLLEQIDRELAGAYDRKQD